MTGVLADEKKWRDLVGGFILAFGEIELLTYHLWPDYCPRTKAPRFFKPRAEALLKVLRKRPKENQETIQSLEEAIKLAEKRNTVAHNPTMVEAYEHSATGQLLYRRGIFSRTSKDFIDDAELTELEAAARNILGRLYRQYGVPQHEQNAS